MGKRHRPACELKKGAARCLCNAFWLTLSLGLAVLAIAIGFRGSVLSGSLGVGADTSHTLVDAVFYLFTIYIQVRLYFRPKEDEHLWEHRASKVTAALFLAAAICILPEAFRRGVHATVDSGLAALIAFVIAILNIGQFGLVKLAAQNRTTIQLNRHNGADAVQSVIVSATEFLGYMGLALPGLLDNGVAGALAIYYLYQGFDALNGGHTHD